LCPTEFTARRLRPLQHRGSQVSVQPGGINAGALAAFSLPASERHGIIVAGRLIEHKRVADAIRALALVRQTHPDCGITIVGKGPEEAALRALAQELGLTLAVTFLSGLEEADFYAALGRSACLLLPSEREGQGLVVAEAQAVGTPPIVAQAPESAAPDLLREGEDGLLYQVGNVPALASAIVRILDDPLLRERLATGGLESAASLDWNRAILPRLVALYERMLGMPAEHRPGPEPMPCA
jgi:glycogen(starch) synthase